MSRHWNAFRITDILGEFMGTGGLPHEGTIMGGFDVFSDVSLNKLSEKQLSYLWLEAPLRPCNDVFKSILASCVQGIKYNICKQKGSGPQMRIKCVW